MEEPSVLDYVKSKLNFQRREDIEIPPDRPESPQALKETSKGRSWHWRPLLALGLALVGQATLESRNNGAMVGIVFYLAAFGLLGLVILRSEWKLISLPCIESRVDPMTIHLKTLLLALLMALLAFLAFSGNLFTSLNVTLWLLALGFFILALWLPSSWLMALPTRLKTFIGQNEWRLSITRWSLLVLGVAALVIFFRLYRIADVPAEPFSDHAEKILDVYDITQGQTAIFFPRNTGREAFQMYWTVLIARILGTGLSFLTLKLGTVILGLLTLPYIYLLGKELGSRRVGLLALLFFGIAYWPNVISRAGLRFTLYPLFLAPTLYYLLRGLRIQNRNDFILSGFFLGLGLHGYSPFRIVPFIILITIGLFLLHNRSKINLTRSIWWLALVGFTALVVFLPLARYVTENPEGFSYRAVSRLADVEQPLPAPVWQVFFSNLWNALRMFNWDDGDIWVNSIPHRPALDVVSGVFFLFGLLLLLVRYIRKRNWLDLFLLLSIPLLQLPSILSLAFPGENPALNRTAGVAVPAFLIVALAFDGLLTTLMAGSTRRLGIIAIWSVTGVLLLWSITQNYNLVFKQYARQYRQGAWNTSDIGKVIKQFAMTYGSADNAWIIPYPHWVDTRLPGVWAGIPNRDFAVWKEDLPDTFSVSGAKLFIARPDDQESLAALQQLYPMGISSLYTSEIAGHDFIIFFVPPMTP
jgi:4-amino-4-deoxy-L-arabinose transferase-like glycosyltransferase